MIKELIHDPILLSKKSVEATKEDLAVVEDLLDTLIANRKTCVGMAANMIGVYKRIIVFVNEDGTYISMVNPIILKQELPFETEERCLSYLGGPTKCKRYKKIKVQYQTKDLSLRIKTFTGFTAQIIQHEIDHCNGILI